MYVPPELRHLSNQDIKRALRPKPAFDDRAAHASLLLRQTKLGFTREPFPWVSVGVIQNQPTRHWTKPTWWERVKGQDGKWSAIPHYGKPALLKGWPNA